MNLAAALQGHEDDRVALVEGDRSVTFGELRALADHNRAVLADHDIGPGDRVALVAGNEVDFAVGTLAVLGRGAVIMPLLPTSPQPEIERKLSANPPKALLAGHAGRWLLDRSPLDLPVIAIEDEASRAGDAPPIEARSDEDLACAMPTSGVTSDPKIALLTHGNLAYGQILLTENPEGIHADDVALGALPFSHIYGLNLVLLAGLRAGSKTVLQTRFREDETLRLVAEHGVTILPGAPIMWQRLASAEGADNALATVRRASSGAAALPRSVYHAIRDRFGVEIGEGYGLTETSSLVASSIGLEIKPGSVGRPMEGVDLVIVDDEGEPVEDGEIGEIVVRGPNIFQGYLNAPEATDSVLTEDGWFWTGDIGLLDDDGYLHLVDRVRDMIIVSGFNVFPAEVESVLREHPSVEMAVVVGEASEKTGETVVAHVVTKQAVNQSDLAEFTRSRLSEYKCPSTYRFVQDLPIAPTGKPIRRRLRQ